MCTRICFLHFSCQPTAAELFKSFNDYIPGKWNWSFYENGIGICTDGAAVMRIWLSVLLLWPKSSLNESTHHVRHTEKKCWLAEKYYLILTTFCRTLLKLLSTEHMLLTHVCLWSSMRRLIQSTNVLSYIKVGTAF